MHWLPASFGAAVLTSDFLHQVKNKLSRGNQHDNNRSPFSTRNGGEEGIVSNGLYFEEHSGSSNL